MMECKNSVAMPAGPAKRGAARHALLMVMAIGLMGCGQKGPLTLTKPMPVATPASAAAR
jgi:predicted small lipoprotein YifL